MENSIKENVRRLLQVAPDLRDNDWELALTYNFHFLHLSDTDFILSNKAHQIINARKDLQHDDPSLRGIKYEARQKYCNKFRVERRKERSQEKPENLGNIEDVSHIFQNETLIQKSKRFISKFF